MTLLRILVILLLLANIGWLAWSQWQVTPPVETTGTAATLPPAADVPSLELLSERPEPVLDCYALGPFRDQAEARRVGNRVADYARRQQLRDTEATEDRGWWVYLPAPENRALATQSLRDLRQAGFGEAYLINSGEYRDAISLGLFGDEANARALFDEITSAGFEPVMGGRTETVTHYWVDYEPDGGVDAPWQIITRRDPMVGRHAVACFPEPAASGPEEVPGIDPGEDTSPPPDSGAEAAESDATDSSASEPVGSAADVPAPPPESAETELNADSTAAEVEDNPGSP